MEIDRNEAQEPNELAPKREIREWLSKTGLTSPLQRAKQSSRIVSVEEGTQRNCGV
jgi:hypothetical protein